ncbi:MAG: type II secretion system F family protein [Planctomycetaceae bacterium]|nr:type II secretion system F family protein [Planctomycetaceae bacterium]
MHEDKLPFLMLMLLAGSAVMTVGITAWRCAVSLQRMSADNPEPSSGVAWYRMVGWILMWGGALSLFALAVGSGAMAAAEPAFVTWSPAAVLVAALTLAVLSVVIRATAGLRSSLIAAAESSESDDRDEASPWSVLSTGLLTPLGLLMTCVIATASLAILFEIGVLTFGIAASNEQNSVIVLMAALVAEAATFTGLLLAMAAETLTLPFGTVDVRQRTLWSRLLSTIGLLAGLVAIGPLVAVGSIAALFLGVAVILFPVIGVSTLGGRRRAGELSAFWTLLHAVKTRAPLERELEAQAESATGRARFLLSRTSRDLAAGIPLEEAAFQRGLVPQSAWLEVRAGMSSGLLKESLQAAAVRETERFSRMSSPGTSRLSAAYFGILWGVLVLITSFLMYYIIPKFKKIFEDFNTELPEVLVSLIRFSDFMVNYGLLGLLGMGVVASCVAIELLVDYYGWEGMIERFGSRFRLRFATPDLLRGLKWAVTARKPLDGVLQDMAATPATFQVKSGLHRAAAAIRDGDDPWAVLCDVGWIRSEEAELLRCAQAAGNLPWALDTLSLSVANRRSYRTEWWLQVLHPVLVLTAAVFVGWFAIAMFLPLVKLLNDLS